MKLSTKTTLMKRRSFQLALPRLPKVQNTTAPSEVSSAKYCSSVLPPANIALSAVPARISPPGPTFFLSREMSITTTDDIEPKTKAQSVTI